MSEKESLVLECYKLLNYIKNQKDLDMVYYSYEESLISIMIVFFKYYYVITSDISKIIKSKNHPDNITLAILSRTLLIILMDAWYIDGNKFKSERFLDFVNVKQYEVMVYLKEVNNNPYSDSENFIKTKYNEYLEKYKIPLNKKGEVIHSFLEDWSGKKISDKLKCIAICNVGLDKKTLDSIYKRFQSSSNIANGNIKGYSDTFTYNTNEEDIDYQSDIIFTNLEFLKIFINIVKLKNNNTIFNMINNLDNEFSNI